MRHFLGKSAGDLFFGQPYPWEPAPAPTDPDTMVWVQVWHGVHGFDGYPQVKAFKGSDIQIK
jgi:hypothetical protein